MSVLTASKLAKFYGADEIFSEISLEVPQQSRIAIVGPNGAGKTTLIEILQGIETPTEGNVSRASGIRMGYLTQDPKLDENRQLWDEQFQVFQHLKIMEDQMRELEMKMLDPQHHDEVLEAYSHLQTDFEHQGGYTYESRIKLVLHGLGFGPEDYDKKLGQLSGGQKMRASLARLLLEEPDILFLDEPTNHLDIQAVEWLESFLRTYSGAVIAISHDRYFIDHYANIVWEIEWGRLEVYRGNYSHYIRQRDERRERLLKMFDSQQEFISKEMAYIRKHMGSRWTAQAKGRLKKLETMKKRGKIIAGPPRNRKKMMLDMKGVARSGNEVLITRKLDIGYHDDKQVLFHVPDILLLRSEIAALIGPNGAGKTTFIKTVLELLEPLKGELRLGANVKPGYFAQAHEKLNHNYTIMEEIRTVTNMMDSEIRDYLGKFLFSGEDVYRLIGDLSGGERGRVALAKLGLSGANLLLLDEPSNHLDIDSQEVLQDVLNAFNGTIILVSHDRYLIDALATQIWSISAGKMDVFEGGYQEYIAQKSEDEVSNNNAPDKSSKSRSKLDKASSKILGYSAHELNKLIEALEGQIDELESKLAQLSASIESQSQAGHLEQVAELGLEFQQTEAQLNDILAQWEELASARLENE